ncbi:Uncharacterised protein [Serratia fonticola]|uniref:hypothetical protein n=1 Tax=Serratia fonticola TaxID=47917 RepID=UPI002179E019|nr:hypothetical protein [Serratia fonticola]CAI1917866.1 Uncharacterised protein [Serratia fonticola]
MKKVIVLCFTVLIISGCAQKIDPAVQAEANKPLICKDEKECDIYWKRSQFWVANNSHWKVQTVTDTIISTHNPAPNSPLLAYQISKMPNDDGTSRIFIKPFCDNIFGCQPDPDVPTAAFKKFVRTGQ